LDLTRQVSRFQVGGARPEPAQAERHAPARNPVAEQQARLRAFARPGAAAATAPAAEWEEF
jgi:methyl-accepting chemotaxis protein